MSPLDGRRQDVGHRYLHPLLQSGGHQNLHVLVKNQVLRILFNDKRAVGVEYRPKVSGNNTTKTVSARKLVVASAGSFGSPLLLERSGIGNPEVLEKAGVPVTESLPGVGGNFQGI